MRKLIALLVSLIFSLIGPQDVDASSFHNGNGGGSAPTGTSIDHYKSQLWDQFYFNSTTPNSDGWTGSATGVASAASATMVQSNGYVSWRGVSTATTGNIAALLDASAGTRIRYDLAPDLYQVLTPITTTSVRYMVGLGSGTTSALLDADLPGATGSRHAACFRYSTAASDTNWKCITSNGSADTVTDSGVAFSAALTKFRIDATSPTEIKFYINDTLVATNSATLPGATTYLRAISGVETLTNAAASADINRRYIEVR